ncbi:hypothetical protein Tco_0822622 [Tanacetum coccineum]|uniref:Uncharacterized protein n=1 Tax=Tanacetum coccineum TaxID=301880 RepID=A0ABQ5AJV4_9ASTR
MQQTQSPSPSPTVRVGLATLGLVDEKDSTLSSIDLLNSSLLRIRYFSLIWRVLMLHIVKCLGACWSAQSIKRSEKKKILSSPEPKTSKNARESQSKKQVVETQHAEESVAIANSTKSLEASESAEELRNQLEPADAKKEQVTIVEEGEESPFDTELEIRFSGKLDQEMNVDADITFIGSSSIDQDMEEADSKLESMPDDKVMSISRNEDGDC